MFNQSFCDDNKNYNLNFMDRLMYIRNTLHMLRIPGQRLKAEVSINFSQRV